jgi:tetratricopeptide (TPR) repeat protein
MLHQRWADLLGKQGHLVEAIRHLRLAIASLDQTEEAADGAFWYWRLALWSLQLGDLDSAVQYSGQNLSWAEASRGPYYLSWGQWLRGLILTCVGDLLGAEESLVRSLSNIKGDDDKVVVVAWLCHLLLGEIHMRVGNGSLALADFQRAAALSKPGVPAPTGGGVGRIWFTEIGSVLHGLEAAAPDKATFQDLCRSYPYRDTFVTESPPRRIPDYFALTQWYLEPADTAHEAGPQVRSEPPGFAFGDNQLGKAWSWHDPIGDCSFRTTTSEGDGVVLLAANNRGLAYINHSAPRLLHRLEAMETATGFVLAAIAVPAAEDRPATGGLLLWVDEDNFVRLDWGKLGPRDVALLACKRGQDMLIGRGRLPDASGEHVPGPAPRPTRVWLRFAVRRTGDSADIGLEPAQRVPLWHVTALCSVNGKQWWTAGSTTFALPPSAKGGVYATGRIDRVVHPGAWPHGTGIAFRSVQLRTIE